MDWIRKAFTPTVLLIFSLPVLAQTGLPAQTADTPASRFEAAAFAGFGNNPGAESFGEMTASAGGSFSCFLFRGLAVEAGVQYDNRSLNMDRWLDGNTWWTDLNVKYVFRRDKRFQPYVTGGYTWARTTGNERVYFIEDPWRHGWSRRDFSGSTFNLGGGARYWINTHLGLFGEVRFGGPGEKLGGIQVSDDASFTRFRAGVIFRF